MGITYNTATHTRGLVFYYDEDNPKSGTTTELVLSRSPIASSAGYVAFAHDALIGTTGSQAAGNTSLSLGDGFSINVWVRRVGETSGSWDPWCLIDSGGPTNQRMWLGWRFNETSGVHNSFPYWDTANTAQWWPMDTFWSESTVTFNINEWYNYTLTYDNSSRVLRSYINSEFVEESTRPGEGDLMYANEPDIRIWGVNGAPSNNTEIRVVAIHNVALSNSEVQSFYSTTKKRFT